MENKDLYSLNEHISNPNEGVCHCAGHHDEGSCSLKKNHRDNDPHSKELNEEESEGAGCSCCGIDLGEEESHTSCCGVDLSQTPKKGKLGKYWIYLIVSLPILIGSYLLSHFDVYHPYPFTAIFDPAWVVIVLCGTPIYRGAIKNLKRKKITAALLISIAMTASILMGILMAFGIGEGHGHGSYIFAAGEIAFLMTLGQQIEGVTSRKSRSAIKSLIDMTPVLATLKTEEGYVDVNVNTINKGDILLTRPHEVIALDGIVVSGVGSVDTSSITGEYAPLDVGPGDVVYAGTRNLDSALEIEATSVSSDTTLSKLIAYVKEAEKKKAPFVRLADKWASYFVPCTCILSLLVFFIALFGFKVSALDAVQRAITVLIVVCPCAMTLAVPIGVAAGIGNASKKGILVKSGVAFEALSKIKVVCLDKTGTLTEGKPVVQEIIPYGIESEELLRLSASAESKSEHLIGKAIVKAYNGTITEPSSTESKVGVGIKAVVEGKEIEIVKLSSVLDKVAESEKEKLISSPSTTVAVMIDGEYKGAILITDSLREGSQIAVNELKALGVKPVMLTGDNHSSATLIASKVGIEEVKAGLLPEDKVEGVESYKAEGKVLMVGDGVNDAPAMSASDTSLAMGAMGNSVAIETADVSLLANDLKKVPFLIKLSRVTFRLVTVNIILSLCISLTSVILSALGLLNAVSGALVHNASSVYVCLSASLLLFFKEKHNK
ncbi:MAG: cadmium-translocating P-type ATPase [Clostridia bacterium]|nr:cadmium-translocating P-type ATPase [Clostridia bacterium]